METKEPIIKRSFDLVQMIISLCALTGIVFGFFVYFANIGSRLQNVEHDNAQIRAMQADDKRDLNLRLIRIEDMLIHIFNSRRGE